MAHTHSDSGIDLSSLLAGKAVEGADRLVALDKWLAGRIEEANQAEARLAKRLEYMTRAEEGLRAVFESLRKQVSEAFPLINQMQQFRPLAEAAAQEVQTRGQELKALLGQAKTEAEAIVQPLPRQIDHEAARLKAMIEQTVESAGQRVKAKVEELENKASVFENWLKEQSEQVLNRILAEMQSRAEVVEQEWRDRLAGQMGQLDHRAKVLGEGMQRKVEGFQKSLEDLSKVAERVLRQSMQEAQASAESKGQTLRAEGEARFERLRNELLRLSTDYRKQADDTLGEVKLALRKEVEQAGGEIRQTMSAVNKQIEETRSAAARQMQQELESIKASIQQRLEELRTSGQSMAEQVEEELTRRIRTLRPQFNREIELAEKLLGERITRLADELQATVELRESQLASRMEDLRPRAAAVWRSIEAEMAAKAAALEHEANTLTGWLERRMTQRIDELVQRSRRVLQRAMGHMDLVTTQAAAEPAKPTTPAMEVTKRSGLEVELFVDGRSKRKLPTEEETQHTDATAA